MRKTSLATFTLVVLAAAPPVRGQDVSPPRDVPPPSIDEQRKRAVVPRLDTILHHLCRSGETASLPPGFSCPLSCAPDDRACEVFLKMHGVVGDDPLWFKRKTIGR